MLCISNNNYLLYRQRAQHQRQSLGLPTDSMIPSTTTSSDAGKDAPCDVYLCYRAYNHIAGKLTRLTTTVSY